MAHPPHIPGETTDSHIVHVATPVKYLLISLVVGALSGFIASLAYTAYGPSTRPVISNETTRIERVAETIEERRITTAQESVAAFYTDKLDQPLGIGFAITGDGWFITTPAAAKGKRVIMHPRAAGVIEKIVTDPASQLVFVKTSVKNARLLDSSELDALARGSKLAIVLPQTAIPVTLQDANVCVTDRCPSEYGDRISYAATIVEHIPHYTVDGAPVITQQGQLVGVALRAQQRVIIIPITQLRPGFESVFATGASQRPQLNVRVINATRWPLLDTTGNFMRRGFVVESSSVSELKEGDVITHVERRPIEATTSLFDLVHHVYSLGKAVITVERKGVITDITVPLKR